jgi:type IV secretory pathway VirB6-like protein
LNGSERSGTFARCKRVRIANSFFNGVRVESPQFQRVIHSARDDPSTFQIEIGTEDFVTMALDTAKNSNALISSYVP